MRTNIATAIGCVLAAVMIAAVTWPGSVAAAVSILVAGVIVGASMIIATLRRRPHVPWDQARRQVGGGRAVIFWKPTCRYCTRLRRALRDDDRMVWVNVWVDRDANTEVRRHNGGDELTPTALVGGRVLRNPSAADLHSALA